MSEIPTLKISSGRRRIVAPTRGRVVLVDAQGYTTAGDTVVPAIVHDVIDRDLITFVAHDKRGKLSLKVPDFDPEATEDPLPTAG